MQRDVALRIDGMLINIRGALDALAHYSKSNLTEEEFIRIRRAIAESMSSTVEISTILHKEHPDIIPKELVPRGRSSVQLNSVAGSKRVPS